jgi:hypothetical protein
VKGVRDIGRRIAQEVHEKESSNTKREGVFSLPWGKIDDGGGGILEGKLKAGGKDGWSAKVVLANTNANLGRNFSTRHIRT